MDTLGFVFGMSGLSFGLLGFVFGITANNTTAELAKRMEQLEERLDQPAAGDAER